MATGTGGDMTAGGEVRGGAAFFDIDGTLVWRDFEALAAGGSGEGVLGSFGAPPTPGVYDAFRRMRERGNRSFICTGRPLCMIYPSLRALEPDGIVACAGAWAAVGDEVVRDERIDPALTAEVARRFHAAGFNVLFECNDASVELAPEGAPTRFPGSTRVDTPEEVARLADADPFAKFCTMGLPREALDPLRDFFEPHFTASDLQGGVFEFSLRGVDKGTAIAAVLGHLGRAGDLAGTCAFGDSENDLSMAGAVETFVAMGNALPGVRAAADYVTDSAADDGVVTGLEHLGLI